MIIYERNINKKLFSLRIVFFLLVTSSLLAFQYNHTNLGYFLSVVTITLSIIVIKDFIVFEDSFQICKYYFFGLIKRKWEFNKSSNINVTSYDSEFWQNDDMPNIDDSSGTGLGCLFSIFFIFKPSKIVNRQFNFELLDETFKHLKSVHVALNNNEFGFVKDYYLKLEN
jgi:hypothetical protein